MKGDITRSTFRPEKHYNTVRMQQGRVQLDADWNEQIDIQNYFTQSLGKYVIGDSGVIKNSPSFNIVLSDEDEKNIDFTITAGKIYVNGILCELEKNTTYKTQPDYPHPPQWNPDKCYLAYLDVWERDITALEDPAIREPALKGLDTATRTKIIWQVKLMEVPVDSIVLNEQEPEIKNWDFFANNLNPNRKVYLNATTAISDGKLVTSKKGYLGSENQLYRVEIHQSGDKSQATFKWSRNNGIITSIIEKIEGNTIDISSVGRDDLQSFQPNQWVEIIYEEQELKNEPGTLLQLQKVLNKQLDVVGDPIEEKFKDKKKLKIIGWEEDKNTKTAEISISSDWIELEKGIYIQFDSDSIYKTGDYWLIPARAYTKDIDWPNDDSSGQPLKQPYQGIKHNYAPLALLKYSKNSNSSNKDTFTFITPLDYRHTFPSLVNCLDKTGDNMTGNLEIQANLYITHGGKVGIGTKEPDEKLHVDGVVRIGKTTSFLDIYTGNDNLSHFKTNLNGYYFDKDIKIQSGVISSDANNLSLQTNGTTQLSINTNGNVGIGVDIPDEKLQVDGVVRIGKTSSFLDIATGTDNLSHFKTNLNGYYFDKDIKIQSGVISSDANNLSLQTNGTTQLSINTNGIQIQSGVISSDANNLSLQTNGTTRLSINANGNVGVGVDIPDEKLHIDGVVRIGKTASFLDIATGIDNLSHFKTNLNGYYFDKYIKIQSGVISSDANNLLLQTNGTTQLSINTNGNVGIGVDIPDEKLHVDGVVRIGKTSSFLDIATGTDNLSHFKTNLNGYYFDKDIKIQSGVISSDANNLLLQTNGNVGIGVDIPDEKLHVDGVVRIGKTASFLDIATGTDNLSHFKTNLNGYYFDKDIKIQSGVISTDANNLLLQTNGITQMILTTGGDVSVGNSLPPSDTKLYIEGNLRVNGRVFQDSSRELKENISDLSSQEVTEILKNIKPIKFNYKNSIDKDIHAGFLSEDVPSLLTSPDNTAISPVDIVAVLTKAVKDQHVQISILLNALKEQRTQIATLTDKVRVLESK